MLIGPKRSGKGTISRILASVMGAANVVAPTLTGLSTNFGMQPLIGKRIAIIGDARISGKVDTAVISEHILSVTGEDLVTIDRKNREAWTGKLDTKFVLVSNELPRLADASGALASRFIVLLLVKSFFGSEDRGLFQRLIKERSSILRWAIAGYDRLCERGYFIQPDSANEAVRELEDLGSPIGAFVRDQCIIDSMQITLAADLYEAFTQWCNAQGRGMVSTLQTFGRDLRAAVPGLKVTQPREFNQKRCYQGIGLKRWV
jgi:putative DNA primase/helicase